MGLFKPRLTSADIRELAPGELSDTEKALLTFKVLTVLTRADRRAACQAVRADSASPDGQVCDQTHETGR